MACVLQPEPQLPLRNVCTTSDPRPDLTLQGLDRLRVH